MCRGEGGDNDPLISLPMARHDEATIAPGRVTSLPAAPFTPGEVIAAMVNDGRPPLAGDHLLFYLTSPEFPSAADASERYVALLGTKPRKLLVLSADQQLNAADAPSLTGLRYSVLAFGDPSYDEFCGFGRKLDARLGELGAHRIADRVDCAPDFRRSADTWLSGVATVLRDSAPAVAPAGPVALPGETRPGPGRWRVGRNSAVRSRSAEPRRTLASV